MSSRILRAVPPAGPSAERGPQVGQMSCAKGLPPCGGRGRDAGAARRASRPVIASPEAMRHVFAEDWARLMHHLYRGAVPISRALGVTEQTARNWLAQNCRPTGDKVALVALRHPEEFTRFIGGR